MVMRSPSRRSNQRRKSSGRNRSHDKAAVTAKILPARNATPIRTLLVYARNKVGKTRLCASCAKIAKTLIIDCEEGSSSISKTEADVYKLTRWEEIDEVFWFLSTQDHGYRFVCIDPITRLGQLAMNFVLEQEGRTSPQQQDWGTTSQLVRGAVERYKALCLEKKMFLIVTAYERRRDSDDEESVYDYVIGPDAQPAVKGFLMGQMDIIGRLYIKRLESEDEDGDEGLVQVERRILFGPHEIYESGDRSDNLPRVMREPTMAKILRGIRNRKEI